MINRAFWWLQDKCDRAIHFVIGPPTAWLHRKLRALAVWIVGDDLY